MLTTGQNGLSEETKIDLFDFHMNQGIDPGLPHTEILIAKSKFHYDNLSRPVEELNYYKYLIRQAFE